MLSILRFFSHLLCIYVSHHLLLSVIDWHKWFQVRRDNQGKIRLLILFFAIAVGYPVSTFFLDILTIGNLLSQDLLVK